MRLVEGVPFIRRLVFVGAFLVMFNTGIAPQSFADTTETFSASKESCFEYFGDRQRMCFDFVNEVRLEPIDSGMRVSWSAGADSAVACSSSNGLTPESCPIRTQRVIASFDPATRTGGTTCTPTDFSIRSCVVPGLRNGVQYSFRIDSDPNWGNWHFYTPFTTVTASPCCSVAGPPSDVQASQVGAALDVTWTASKDWGGATTLKYVVTTDPPSVTCTAEILTCRLEGLDYAKAYKVLVSSKNDAGESTPVSSVSTYTIPAGPPDAPTISGVKFGVGAGAKVTWAPPAKNGGLAISKYTVTAQPGGASCTATSGTSCTVAGLTAGKAYSFTATATNAKGTSKSSAPSVAGKLTGPGVQVGSPSATAAGTTATVTWKTPPAKTGGALVSYVVKANNGGGTCTTKNTRCAIAGLRPGGNYQFAVTTVRTGGASSPVSTPAITMPAPPIPEAPKPTAELS